MNQHPKRANRRTHLTFKELWRPQVMALFMFFAIVGLFFMMGWHIPEKLQATVSVVIYVPCQWFSYWFFYSVAGIYTEN